ncbi:glycoside hydrolase [Rhypophila sp. PSN 637]
MTLFISTAYLIGAALLPGLALGGAVEYARQATPTAVGPDNPVFTVPSSADIGKNVIPNINDPLAVDAQDVCPGYLATNVQEQSNGFAADLVLAGPPCNVYGTDIESLTLTATFQDQDRLRVRIQPKYISKENATFFSLPEQLVPRPADLPGTQESDSLLEFHWSNKDTFGFKVQRKDTGHILFSTQGTKLVFENQFSEFKTFLPENYNLYGLGEVVRGFRLGNNLTRTLFAADVGDNVDANIYGSHPVYLDTRYFTKGANGELEYAAEATDKSAEYVSYTHGVYLRNAHAQEVLLRPEGVTWRALGGNIDLYFYNGPSAKDVITAYQHTAVGLPALQQYWTLGFHQCRWGYENWTVLQEVVDNFAKFEIPLETIWADIDYMKGYRNFDNDPVRYPYKEGAEFLDKLHANGQHWIPIVDAAIYASNPENASDAYPTFNRGIEANAFLLNPDGTPYIGAVWPGYTVFPDWVGAVLNGSGAIDWWIKELSLWYDKIKYDGIWIDMSEVASFCVGSCGSGNLTLNPAHPPFELPGEEGNLVLRYPEGFNLTNATEAAAASSAMASQDAAKPTASSTTTEPYFRSTPTPGVRNINWPPYAINNFHNDLAVHAVSPNATSHGGYLQYDFHNLNGHQILNATYQALLSVFPGKRPFIIGRSTFAGSGKWAGHWGGDNESLWPFMYFSIPQALSFSLFGIPMFGPDTCGFGGNTDMELCSRWMQLSAFFPFYRNHNILGANSQEPYVWEAVAQATRTAMKVRFELLPWLYTLMVQASFTGDTVMRALSWEFETEPWLASADRQFLLGGGILVTPVLEQGMDTVDGVFPGLRTDGKGEVWYDWYNLSEVAGPHVDSILPGQNVTIEAPLGHILVYQRGGHIIATQDPGMTTREARQKPWGLRVPLDAHGKAEGKLYLDDGVSLEVEEKTWVTFEANEKGVTAVPEGDYTDKNPLRYVTILGLQEGPQTVKVQGMKLGRDHWSYDDQAKTLKVVDLEEFFGTGAWKDRVEITWE